MYVYEYKLILIVYYTFCVHVIWTCYENRRFQFLLYDYVSISCDMGQKIWQFTDTIVDTFRVYLDFMTIHIVAKRVKLILSLSVEVSLFRPFLSSTYVLFLHK